MTTKYIEVNLTKYEKILYKNYKTIVINRLNDSRSLRC